MTFDNATMMRIGSVEPILKDNTHFEITVANPNVELFFKQNKSLILKQLSIHLHNHLMEMDIHLMESSGPQKILTPHEQVSEMAAENPEFGRLIDILSLSLK